jgi:hypothetical protein
MGEHFCTACPDGSDPNWDQLEECCGLKLCGKVAKFRIETSDGDEWLCAEHYDLLFTYERDTGYPFPYFSHDHKTA